MEQCIHPVTIYEAHLEPGALPAGNLGGWLTEEAGALMRDLGLISHPCGLGSGSLDLRKLAAQWALPQASPLP